MKIVIIGGRDHRRDGAHRVASRRPPSRAGPRGRAGISGHGGQHDHRRGPGQSPQTQFFEFFERIADEATDGEMVRIPPVLFQPMAAADVANAVSKVAVGAPLNGVVEVAGPRQYRFDEFIRQGLSALHDPRDVVADPHERYFGAELKERSLVPGADASLGEVRFEDWLKKSAVRAVPA